MGDADLLSWINTGKNIAALLVAIGVAGEFAGDWISGPITHRIESAKQDEMARLTASSNSLKAELADAVAKGKEADARIAEAHRGAAEANHKAEAEHLARVQIEEELAWRVISDEQEGRLLASIPHSLIGLQIGVTSIMGDAEGARYALDIIRVLNKAGIVTGGLMSAVVTPPIPEGVRIRVNNRDPGSSVVLLQEAFMAAGIDADGMVIPSMREGEINILVGVKPQPAKRTNN
jgi:hypothetical protein